MKPEDRLIADLERLGISYQIVEHEAVFTVEESSAIDRDMPGLHTKNLFLKDKKKKYWLLIVPNDIAVDLKALPTAIGCARVSFGNVDDMMALLGLKPGSVTPLGAMNDSKGRVTVVLDESLTGSEQINVHPLRNTATIGMDGTDLVRLLKSWDHDPVVVKIPVKEEA